MSWNTAGVNQRASSRNRMVEENVEQEIEATNVGVQDSSDQVKENDGLPWYRKPSPWWLVNSLWLQSVNVRLKGTL